MKGLIYHELMLAKKQILLILAIFAGLLIIHIMFLLSYKFGNLSHNLTEEQMEIKAVFEKFYYAEVIVLLIVSGGFVGNIISNAKTGWFGLAYTLPGKINRSVAATYICVVTTELAGFALGCIVAKATSAISGKTPTMNSWRLMISVLLFMLIVFAIILPIAYLLQNANKVAAVIMIPVLIGLSIMALIALEFKNEEELTIEFRNMISKFVEFMDGGMPIMIGATILIVALSGVASVAIMQRKEV